MSQELQEIIGPIVQEIIEETAKTVTAELQPQIEYHKTQAGYWKNHAAYLQISLNSKEAEYEKALHAKKVWRGAALIGIPVGIAAGIVGGIIIGLNVSIPE
jgi:hypothetical protein